MNPFHKQLINFTYDLVNLTESPVKEVKLDTRASYEYFSQVLTLNKTLKVRNKIQYFSQLIALEQFHFMYKNIAKNELSRNLSEYILIILHELGHANRQWSTRRTNLYKHSLQKLTQAQRNYPELTTSICFAYTELSEERNANQWACRFLKQNYHDIVQLWNSYPALQQTN